jgi:hypothetical protein
MNPKYTEKRIRINKIQRKEISEDLDSYRLICSVIKNASHQKIPIISFGRILEKTTDLESRLNKLGLPDYRLEEIKEEIYE